MGETAKKEPFAPEIQRKEATMKEYSEKPDEVLVDLTLLGNESAFETLVLRHEKAVKGTAFKITRNSFSAEDASQDAFVSAWMRLDSLSDRSRFGSWVCAIAKNCARDLVSHYQSMVPDISLDLSDAEEIPDLAYAREEEKRELHNAIDALSEKIREVIRLHYFDGLSVDEIAEKLSLPAGTVKWRLSEGRKQLRKGYGIMEKDYNEKEALVARVMRQVEELKLWRLKLDRIGFAEDYRRVLANVEALEESKEKQHALADVLEMGYWWLSGEKNDETFAKIKQAAIGGHNEEVMQSVIAIEADKAPQEGAYYRETAIPFLEEHGFVKALAYAWFWYGVSLLDCQKPEEGKNAFLRVRSILNPSDVYYANALSAFRTLELQEQANKRGIEKVKLLTTGETLRFIGKKLYFWNQPGFSRGTVEVEMNECIFWNASQCDGLIWDPDAKLGERVTASDGKSTWTLLETDRTVETPAGVFSGCSVTRATGFGYTVEAETAFCPGVGIVWQRATRQGVTTTWLLSQYTIAGGEGIIPFATGNCWEYVPTELPKDYVMLNMQNRFDITSFENGSAVISSYSFVECLGYADTFAGKLREIRESYHTNEAHENGGEHLIDVKKTLRRAIELAATKREKTLIGIAANVMRRIFATDPEQNPDYTEVGRWNFFDETVVKQENERITLDPMIYHLEWKNMGSDLPWREKQALYGDLYTIVQDAAGFTWSEEWIPGYLLEEDGNLWGNSFKRTVRVLEDETVETSAGVFPNCRHVSINATNYPKNGVFYRTGQMEAWYAPGVGLVQYSRPMNGVPENLWQLTEYTGTGEGYFPVGDGLFRRYAPRQTIEGWRASVEYTFDTDETGTVCFRNTTGTQDRAHYEMFLKKWKAEQAGKPENN